MLYPISKDNRYIITREYCGQPEARYVLRFCGEFIAQSISKASLVVRAHGHNAVRLGATPITAIDKPEQASV